MANFNKVILIGRLTADPEVKANGNLAYCRFVVNNPRKNKQSGEWEDNPCFIDIEAWNRGDTGKMAEMVLNRCRKGSPIMVEGKLFLDQWEDKNGGGKRSKHKVVADNIQLLDAKPEGGGQQQRQNRAPVDNRPAYQEAADGEVIPF